MVKRARTLPWFAALLALVAVSVCIRLGFWQLERAETKTQWQQELSERAEAGRRSMAELESLQEPGNFPVMLTGTPDNEHTILLDNRIHQGTAGYHVLTPIRTASGSWVLLNRGWWPRGRERDQLPAIPAIPESISVAGRSYVYSDKVFTLADDDFTQITWPLRVQRVEMTTLSEVLGVSLLPFEVRAEPDAELETGGQMVREWTGRVMTPERHRAYAVQWFAMAAALVVLILLAALRQKRKSDKEMEA